MEYLDVYDENGNYLKKEARNIVHRDALWHKTVHCWLYDKDGNVYFQIRKDENQLYTTASGHVQSGETVQEGFGREIYEEIGINVDYNSAQLVSIINYVLDRKNADGSYFKDRAFSHVYVCQFDGGINDFHFDANEINGVVKVNAKQTLDLLTKEQGSIDGIKILIENGTNIEKQDKINFEDFLVNKGETALEKYGDVLKKVIEITSK